MVAKEFCQAEKSDKGRKKIDIKAEREIMIKTKKKGEDASRKGQGRQEG